MPVAASIEMALNSKVVGQNGAQDVQRQPFTGVWPPLKEAKINKALFKVVDTRVRF